MKKIILTTCVMLLAFSLIQGQENKEKKDKNSKKEELHIKLKDGAKPDVYVDGKKFDFPMELLDKNRIESVSVIKGDKALRDYNAANGVVLITTKKNLVELDESKIKVKSTSEKSKTPMIVIDGKVSNKKSLEKLAPDDIERIEVVKDKQALKKYNAPNGAIIVTTKKGKQ